MRRNLWGWSYRWRDPVPETYLLRKLRINRDRCLTVPFGKRLVERRSFDEFLTLCDRNGIAVRIAAAIDGRFGGYDLSKPEVWQDLTGELRSIVRACVNHPCVFIHQIDQGLPADDTKVQIELARVLDAVQLEDDSRLIQVGEGDLAGAVGLYATPASSIDHARTRMDMREASTAHVVTGISCGNSPARFAGDVAYRSSRERDEAVGRCLQDACANYRALGAAGVFLAGDPGTHASGVKAFDDVLVSPVRRGLRLSSNSREQIEIMALNDTWMPEPLQISWSYRTGEMIVDSGGSLLEIAPGCGLAHTIHLTLPKTVSRLEGVLYLSASQAGDVVFADEQIVPVLPGIDSVDIDVPLVVVGASAGLKKVLDRWDVRYRAADSSGEIGEMEGLLLIGPDVLTRSDALSHRLMSLAVAGARIIVLAQEYPLHGTGMPVEIEYAQDNGSFGFCTDLDDPVFRNLGPGDMSGWRRGEPTWKNAYARPSAGGRSLVACGDDLDSCALLEVPCGRGVIVCCQLCVASSLGDEPASRVLLRNLLERYGRYRSERGVAGVCTVDGVDICREVEEVSVLSRRVGTPSRAIDAVRYRAAVVRASRRNVEELVTVRDAAEKFQQSGGWILLWGLRADGLDAFGRLMGSKFLIKPVDDGLAGRGRAMSLVASGLTNRDFVRPSLMFSSGVECDPAAALRPRMETIDRRGGLTVYPRGRGGLVLCQFPPAADAGGDAPARLKERVLSVLLSNMGVASRATATAIPGVNVRYESVDISSQCNASRLPGDHSLHALLKATWLGVEGVELLGVRYGAALRPDVGGPDAIVSGGGRIAGVEIGRPVDALFFLHTMEAGKSSPSTVIEYRVNFEDGSSIEVPVKYGEHIAGWQRTGPLGRARAALVADLGERERAVLYELKWENPRPKERIATIDIALHGKECAVLAITAGTVRR